MCVFFAENLKKSSENKYKFSTNELTFIIILSIKNERSKLDAIVVSYNSRYTMGFNNVFWMKVLLIFLACLAITLQKPTETEEFEELEEIWEPEETDEILESESGKLYKSYSQQHKLNMYFYHGNFKRETTIKIL